MRVACEHILRGGKKRFAVALFFSSPFRSQQLPVDLIDICFLILTALASFFSFSLILFNLISSHCVAPIRKCRRWRGKEGRGAECKRMEELC